MIFCNWVSLILGQYISILTLQSKLQSSACSSSVYVFLPSPPLHEIWQCHENFDSFLFCQKLCRLTLFCKHFWFCKSVAKFCVSAQSLTAKRRRSTLCKYIRNLKTKKTFYASLNTSNILLRLYCLVIFIAGSAGEKTAWIRIRKKVPDKTGSRSTDNTVFIWID